MCHKIRCRSGGSEERGGGQRGPRESGEGGKGETRNVNSGSIEGRNGQRTREGGGIGDFFIERVVHQQIAAGCPAYGINVECIGCGTR